jgi:hypothetical protein
MTDYSYEQIPNTNDILFYNSMHVNIFFEGVMETPPNDRLFIWPNTKYK